MNKKTNNDQLVPTSIRIRKDQKQKLKKRVDASLSKLMRQKIDELLASGDDVDELRQKKEAKQEELNRIKQKKRQLEKDIDRIEEMIEKAEEEDDNVEKYFNQNKMKWMNKETRRPIPLQDLTKEEKEQDIRYVKKQQKEQNKGDND